MKIKSVLFFIIVCSTQLIAQDMQTWTWDSYKTKFKVPYDFEVKTNTGEAFSAGNKDINLSIYPQKVSDMTYSKMKTSLAKWVESNGVTVDGDYWELADLNRYWGVMVGGYYQGFHVMLWLLVDPDYTDIGLYVWCSYNESASSIVTDIFYSFTPN